MRVGSVRVGVEAGFRLKRTEAVKMNGSWGMAVRCERIVLRSRVQRSMLSMRMLPVETSRRRRTVDRKEDFPLF